MKLSINIDSENEGCNNLPDLRAVLSKLLDKLRDSEVHFNLKKFGEDEGKIFDFNGNSVGTWKVSK